MNNVEKKFKYL